MNPVCRCLLLCGAFASALAPMKAQTLIGEFPLRGNLNNNVSGGPALVPVAFNGVTGQITSLGYIFAANQGLSFTSAALTPTSFSIELSLNFTTVNSGNGYVKIADFQSLASDAGFYALNGSLNFYGNGNIQTAPPPPDFTSGVTVDVVLTRDGTTGTVAGYVNGVQRFTFVDSSNFAVPAATNQPLNFVVDDLATGQREASGGTLSYLRIYNGALTSTQVSALFAGGPPSSVPEPATAALLTLGAAGVIAWRRRAHKA